jgi:nitrate/nitrite transporter NarK
MTQPTHSTTTLQRLGGIIVLVQLFDIIIHVATDQAEPIRIASNIVIVAWIIARLAGWLRDRFRPISLTAIGTYLLLNLIFLSQAGLTNPEQGSELRTMLFLLMFLTVTLSALFTTRTSVSD